MHHNPVAELEHDQPVVHDFATPDFQVHDVVEARVRPPTLFSVSHQPAVTKDIHRRLHRNIDGTNRELKIKLTDPHLCRELSDSGRQVKVAWYSAHSCQSNDLVEWRRAERAGPHFVRLERFVNGHGATLSWFL